MENYYRYNYCRDNMNNNTFIFTNYKKYAYHNRCLILFLLNTV